MNRTFSLTKRNISLFIRDKAAVFFSFLSTIILVALYFLFIAQMYRQGIAGSPSGDTFSKPAQNFLIYLQMMAGVLILNSMSLSMGVFSTIAKDFESGRVDNFMLTPLRKTDLLVSYLISGFIVSFTLNFLTWIISALLIGILTGYFVAFGTFLTGVVILLAASAISSAIMLFITSIVHSSAAIGVIGSIAGTFLGFLCGIYIPYSSLGSATVKIGSVLPYTHLTIWLKQTLLGDAFKQLSVPDTLKTTLLNDAFSAKNIGFAGINAPLWVMLIFCGIFALICLAAAWFLLKRRISRR